MKIAVATLLLVLATPAHAADLIPGEICNSLIIGVMKATGAEFLRYSPSRENAFVSHVIAGEMHITCTRPFDIDAYFSAANPPEEFFKVISRAGASITGHPVRDVEILAHKCHRAALADQGEMGTADGNGISVECQAFRRDGGSTGIIVFDTRK